jgi:hypothetical protein
VELHWREMARAAWGANGLVIDLTRLPAWVREVVLDEYRELSASVRH